MFLHLRRFQAAGVTVTQLATLTPIRSQLYETERGSITGSWILKSKHISLVVALALAPVTALAHPHIFAEAHLDIVAGDGEVAELQNVWRFDEVFSSSVLLDFDKNTNNLLDHDELAEVGKVVLDSMEEFDYFINITYNGKRIGVERPQQIIADYKDGQLLLIFAAKPKQSIPLDGKLTFGVYDPTLYTAMDFPTDEDMTLQGDGFRQCTHKVVRPDPDKVIEQNQDMLTDAFWSDPTGMNMTKLFATRIEIKCGA